MTGQAKRQVVLGKVRFVLMIVRIQFNDFLELRLCLRIVILIQEFFGEGVVWCNGIRLFLNRFSLEPYLTGCQSMM